MTNPTGYGVVCPECGPVWVTPDTFGRDGAEGTCPGCHDRLFFDPAFEATPFPTPTAAQPEPEPQGKLAMLYKELKSAASDASAAETTAADTLARATTDHDHAVLDVTATTAAYAQAVFAAPGSTVVYPGPPFVVDQSTDGKTVTSLTVASADDPVAAVPPPVA